MNPIEKIRLEWVHTGNKMVYAFGVYAFSDPYGRKERIHPDFDGITVIDYNKETSKFDVRYLRSYSREDIPVLASFDDSIGADTFAYAYIKKNIEKEYLSAFLFGIDDRVADCKNAFIEDQKSHGFYDSEKLRNDFFYGNNFRILDTYIEKRDIYQ